MNLQNKNVHTAINHATLRPVYLFHSSILSQVFLVAFQNTIFGLLRKPLEVTQATCIFPGTQYGKKFWIFLLNSWIRFSYNSYNFPPLPVIGESAKWYINFACLNMKMSNKNLFKKTFYEKTKLYFCTFKNLLKTVH